MRLPYGFHVRRLSCAQPDESKGWRPRTTNRAVHHITPSDLTGGDRLARRAAPVLAIVGAGGDPLLRDQVVDQASPSARRSSGRARVAPSASTRSPPRQWATRIDNRKRLTTLSAATSLISIRERVRRRQPHVAVTRARFRLRARLPTAQARRRTRWRCSVAISITPIVTESAIAFVARTSCLDCEPELSKARRSGGSRRASP